MQKGSLEQRIERAKELLKTVRHAALASICNDGSPLNSPLFVAFDEELNFYWSSNPESLHSQNIDRDGRVFLSLFDSMGEGGGLYIAAHAEQTQDYDVALRTVNATRQQLGRNPVTLDNFRGESTQRLYTGKPTALWVNITKRTADGRILREYRHEVAARDLQ